MKRRGRRGYMALWLRLKYSFTKDNKQVPRFILLWSLKLFIANFSKTKAIKIINEKQTKTLNATVLIQLNRVSWVFFFFYVNA